jgi:hypothetical protein
VCSIGTPSWSQCRRTSLQQCASGGDLDRRGMAFNRNEYMWAYEDTIRNIATRRAPRHAVPADKQVVHAGPCQDDGRFARSAL